MRPRRRRRSSALIVSASDGGFHTSCLAFRTRPRRPFSASASSAALPSAPSPDGGPPSSVAGQAQTEQRRTEKDQTAWFRCGKQLGSDFTSREVDSVNVEIGLSVFDSVDQRGLSL